MWNWHEGKVALEHLFFAGRVVAARRINFERHYDLPERVLPPEVLAAPTPRQAEAQRELTRIAAAALGVATEPDLGDYFRLPRADSKARVAELVDRRRADPGPVKGWGAPAYLWPAAQRPRRIDARALLSPFDPLIWFRPRTERLFGFRYRIEIYTPGREAHPRLLRAPVPARRPARRPRRPEVRPSAGRAARAGRVRRGRGRRRRGRRRAGGRAARRRRLAEPGRRRRGQAQRRPGAGAARGGRRAT